MGVDKERIIEFCKYKKKAYGISICTIQTEPCKMAVERNRCPKMLWMLRMKGANGEDA